MIQEYLSSHYNLITINCFHMAINNDNKYIEKIINERVSLLDIKNRQNKCLRKCKYFGIYPCWEIPKNFLDNYEIAINDEKGYN